MTGGFDISRLLLAAAGVILFLSFGYTEMAGSDMWWHLAAGRELLQTGTPWMVDDWSYSTHGGDWLNHEWLSDIIYYGWVSAFGLSSLVYWKWLVVIGTFGLLQYVLYRENGNMFTALMCAGIAAAVAAPFIDVRPHLYTLLGYSILLFLVWHRQPKLWQLLPLFLVWVNLHGGFFFGLMALGILIFPWRDFSVAKFRSAFLIGLACLAICTLNPSGLKTFLYPLIYAFDSSSPYKELGEWHSPFRDGGIRSPLFFIFMWAPLAAAAFLLPAVRRKTGVPWEAIALTALTLAMALTSRRFIPIFGMSLALLLAPVVSLLLDHLRSRVINLALATLVLIYAGLRLLPYPLQSAPAFHYLTAEYSYPDDMVSLMLANGFTGNVYALYNWGGYLHWRTDGELKVFIDGRADTVYDAETYYHYINVMSGKPGWIESIEDTGAEFIMWPSGRRNGNAMLEALVATGRWQPIYQDTVSWLVARADRELPEQSVLPPESPAHMMSIAMASALRGNTSRAMEYTRKVRAQVPWQKNACQLEMDLLRHQQKTAEANAVLQDCLSYFPTRMLR